MTILAAAVGGHPLARQDAANGVLRIRCSTIPDRRCSHIARRRAATR